MYILLYRKATMLKLSRMMQAGTPAPDFSLPSAQGGTVSLADFAGSEALLVAFLCNHCPFVLHVLDALIAFAHDYRPKGLAVVAISSNDTVEFPEDGFEHMVTFAREHALPFPYLHDATQQVALAYEAICTPDFFLFDRDRRLFYAGQFDSSRPRIDRPPVPGLPPMRTDLPVTGEDLRRAADAVLAGAPAPHPQRPSAGCSIKWKPGMEPVWG
jgi:peroxiredoxin